MYFQSGFNFVRYFRQILFVFHWDNNRTDSPSLGGKEFFLEATNWQNFTTQRVVYPTTASTGGTVFSEPGNPAIAEIEAIMGEVMELLA